MVCSSLGLLLWGCVAKGTQPQGEAGVTPTDGVSLEPHRPPDKKKPTDLPKAKKDKPKPDLPKPKDWWSPTPDKPKPPDLPKPPDMGKPDLPKPPTCKDVYESNNNCSLAKYLGTSTMGAAWITRSATLDPASDVDWFSAKGLEKSHTCFPGTSQKYYFKARLQVPAGRTLKVCVYKGSCSGSSACKSGAGPTQLEAQVKVSGICGLNDDTEARILVQNLGSNGGCAPYSISFYYAD